MQVGRKSFFHVLTQKQIEKIHTTSLEILEKIGMQIYCPDIIRLMEKKGYRIEGKTVYFDAARVNMEALKKQKTPCIYTKDGQCLKFDKRNISIHNSSGASEILDLETGELRQADSADLKNLVILLNKTDIVETIDVPVYPQDINQAYALIYGAKETLKYTDKAIVFSGYNTAKEASTLFEMLEVFRKDDKDLAARPLTMGSICPQSPLQLMKDDLDATRIFMENGCSIAIIPAPLAGISSPLPALGALTQMNAEFLGTLAVLRVLDPEVSVIYCGRSGSVDLKKGVFIDACPDDGIIAAATVQIADYYGVPSDVYGSGTSSALNDGQMGSEKMHATLLPLLAGAEILSGVGSIAKGLAMSPEQIIIDREIFAAALHSLTVFKDGEDDYGISVIEDAVLKAIDPISNRKTANYLRSGERYALNHKLYNYGDYQTWSAEGRKSIASKAKEIIAEELLDPQVYITEDQERALEEIYMRFVDQAERIITGV